MTELRWSRLVRVRDGGRCVLCGGAFPIFRLQAHHIRPKSIYPERALDLRNGVALCAGCHQGPVHRHNAALDVQPNNRESGWRLFVPLFDRWTGLASQRKFARAALTLVLLFPGCFPGEYPFPYCLEPASTGATVGTTHKIPL